jgi:hypothetical protein
MKLKLKPWQQNVLSAIVIIVAGYILFNLAFLLAALVINGITLLTGGSFEQAPKPYATGVYLLLIAVISWLVFRSKLSHLVKATYMTMPLMVALVYTGILLYQQPMWVPIGVGAVIVGAVLFFIYRRKLPWLYYFATLYVAAMGLFIVLGGIEI